MTDFIYKICPSDLWARAAEEGIFSGSGVDLVDGFIHFSTVSQVVETVRLHFRGVGGLVLVKVRCEGLDIVWEASRGGCLFPHLYGVLPLTHVVEVFPLVLSESGCHIFPSEVGIFSG